MKFLKFLTSRLMIIVYLLVIQMALLLGVAIAIMTQFRVFFFISVALSLIVILALVRKDKPAAFKLTWVIVVGVLLPIGGIVYLLFGDKRPTRKVAQYVKEHALIAKYLDMDDEPNEVKSENCGRMSSLFRYIRNASAYHAYKNTAIDYYGMGEDMFSALLDD